MDLFCGGERTTKLTFFLKRAIIIIVNEKGRKKTNENVSCCYYLYR